MGSRGEGGSAPAALLGVRIFEGESRLDQGIFPVERHAVEKHHALGVDEDLHAIVELEDLVGWARFGIELELVAQAGATAAEDAQAETAGNVLFLEGLADFVNGFGSYLDHMVLGDRSLRSRLGTIGSRYAAVGSRLGAVG